MTHLRTSIENLLDALDYDFNHFTLENFIKHIETQIERRILFIEWPMPPYMSGVWISHATEPVEFVFVDRNLSGMLLAHVKLHELAHIVFNHDTLQVTPDRIPQVLTSLQRGEDQAVQAIVRSVLRRSIYVSQEEQAAEMWASVILERVASSSRLNELKQASSQAQTRRFLREVGLDL
jgi:hypothetical protein